MYYMYQFNLVHLRAQTI